MAAFYIDNEELEKIRRGAEELDASIQAEAQRRQMYATAPPAPARAPNLAAPLPTAPPAPPRTDPRLTARETADREVLSMVVAACRSDWDSVSSGFLGYSELWDLQLRALDSYAASRPHGCERNLLYRLAALRRAGESLDLNRLYAEAAAASAMPTPPSYDGAPLERERPQDESPRGAITPGDRPSQGGAQRRLGNGWKGF